ncbi:MAG: Uma2 family endonuclease [Candidatus Competibacteraceae bacterium]|nr:Uma2 family endonuclease [Candidatus Competibacteraceae bacterium]
MIFGNRAYTVAMGQARKIQRYSLDQYLALERDGEVRHEFLDGEIVAMVGSSRLHNALATRLIAALYGHLRGTPCRVAGSDMKVLVAPANRVYYPDLVVSCADPAGELDEYTESHPRLIIEILSPSTAMIDRREKRLAYGLLESLQDYVLVAQDEAKVEVYSRQQDGWTHTLYGVGETVLLPSVDLALPVGAIYEGLPALR